jgi:hypothetical protein
MDHLQYPCLIFVYFKNPDYGKSIKLEDIKEPSYEYYTHCLENSATLGRGYISYGDFSIKYIQSEFDSLKRTNSCQILVTKFAAICNEDILNFYNDNKENIRAFVDNKLNNYFGLAPVDLKIDIS